MAKERTASRVKGRLFASIKNNAESATKLRLEGRIEGAMSHEQDVNNAMRVAERKGWGAAAYAAEQTGIARGMTKALKKL